MNFSKSRVEQPIYMYSGVDSSGGVGGMIMEYRGTTQARARSARAGGGCGRGVSPLPAQGNFAFS